MRYIKNYWDKDRCLEFGLKCNTKKEFKDKYPGAYTASRRNNWLEEIWINMTPIGNSYKRCIYAYEFEDKHVYVGLTYNLIERNKRHHMEKYGSIVLKYEKETNLKPILKKISDYIDKNKASLLEGKIINLYRERGWIILNKLKSGSLGGQITIWTKEKCIEAALSCKTKNEFLKKFRGAHQSAKINGWLDEIQKHMVEIIKPRNYWTKEKCIEIASKCQSKNELKKLSISAYTISYRNGWLDEVCSHMK